MDVAPVTHGVTNRSVELGEFRFTETSHTPHTRLGSHRHAHPAVTFVLQGGFVEDFGSGRALDCAPMSILLKPADAVHSNQYSSHGARSFIVECASESPVGQALDECAPQFGLAHLVVPMLELCTAVRAEAPERRIRAEELMLEISKRQRGRSGPKNDTRPSWLARIADVVSEECTQTLHLTVLASDVGVHPVYLARVFRRHYGMSIGSYMLQCRVRRAMRRLATSADPISRIALECGFADQAHFTRLFRREAGVPPGQFRRLKV